MVFIYKATSLAQSQAHVGWCLQSEYYYSHLQGLSQGHTSSKWQGLDWSCHYVLLSAVNSPRVRRYHSDSPKSPISQLQTGKDVLTQCTIDQMTLLTVERAWLPGGVPWLDHSQGHQVWKAGRYMESAWTQCSLQTVSTWKPQSLWEKQAFGKPNGLPWIPLEIVLAQPCHSTSRR